MTLCPTDNSIASRMKRTDRTTTPARRPDPKSRKPERSVSGLLGSTFATWDDVAIAASGDTKIATMDVMNVTGQQARFLLSASIELDFCSYTGPCTSAGTLQKGGFVDLQIWSRIAGDACRTERMRTVWSAHSYIDTLDFGGSGDIRIRIIIGLAGSLTVGPNRQMITFDLYNITAAPIDATCSGHMQAFCAEIPSNDSRSDHFNDAPATVGC